MIVAVTFPSAEQTDEIFFAVKAKTRLLAVRRRSPPSAWFVGHFIRCMSTQRSLCNPIIAQKSASKRDLGEEFAAQEPLANESEREANAADP